MSWITNNAIFTLPFSKCETSYQSFRTSYIVVALICDMRGNTRRCTILIPAQGTCHRPGILPSDCSSAAPCPSRDCQLWPLSCCPLLSCNRRLWPCTVIPCCPVTDGCEPCTVVLCCPVTAACTPALLFSVVLWSPPLTALTPRPAGVSADGAGRGRQRHLSTHRQHRPAGRGHGEQNQEHAQWDILQWVGHIARWNRTEWNGHLLKSMSSNEIYWTYSKLTLILEKDPKNTTDWFQWVQLTTGIVLNGDEGQQPAWAINRNLSILEHSVLCSVHADEGVWKKMGI